MNATSAIFGPRSLSSNWATNATMKSFTAPMLLRIPDDVSTASTKSSGDVQLEVVDFGSHATSERQGTVEGPHVGADAEASESATSNE